MVRLIRTVFCRFPSYELAEHPCILFFRIRSEIARKITKFNFRSKITTKKAPYPPQPPTRLRREFEEPKPRVTLSRDYSDAGSRPANNGVSLRRDYGEFLSLEKVT